MSLSSMASTRNRPTALPLLPSSTPYLPIPPFPPLNSPSATRKTVFFEGTRAVYVPHTAPEPTVTDGFMPGSRCVSDEELALAVRFNTMGLRQEQDKERDGTPTRRGSEEWTPGTESESSSGGIFWADKEVLSSVASSMEAGPSNAGRNRAEPPRFEGQVGRKHSSGSHGENRRESKDAAGSRAKVSPPVTNVPESRRPNEDLREIFRKGRDVDSIRGRARESQIDCPADILSESLSPGQRSSTPTMRPALVTTRSFSSYKSLKSSPTPTAEPAMAMLWPGPFPLGSVMPIPPPKPSPSSPHRTKSAKPKSKKDRKPRPKSVHTSPEWSALPAATFVDNTEKQMTPVVESDEASLGMRLGDRESI